MNFFSDCKTKEEAKSTFRKLSMHFHPDKGGDKDLFLKLKQQYDSFKEPDVYHSLQNPYSQFREQVRPDWGHTQRRSAHIFENTTQKEQILESALHEANYRIKHLLSDNQNFKEQLEDCYNIIHQSSIENTTLSLRLRHMELQLANQKPKLIEWILSLLKKKK